MIRLGSLGAIGALALVACGGGHPAAGDPDAPAAKLDAPASPPPVDAPSPPPPPPPVDAPDWSAVTCATPPPPGAIEAPPLPAYSGGTCPTLAPGTNVIRSSGSDRSFILVLPADYTPGARLPAMVMWHWLGGSASRILERGNAQAAADSLHMIIAAPEKKGDLTVPLLNRDFVWPYLTVVPAARLDEEARFFDDMLACIDRQYPIDRDCVSTVGVSAGALWVSQLVQLRADRLASAIVISGGIGPALDLAGGTVEVRGWSGTPRAVPTLVLWGGPTDRCVVHFEEASHNLEAALAAQDHFLVECVHDCGHAQPPMDDPMHGIEVLYHFAADHPFWLPRGQSPYLTRGLPAGMPSWCAIGAGQAVPRTGACVETSIDSGCPPI